MIKSRNSDAWLEEGYNLFASEGFGGIQIERLARILQLNKSGFYHYFGDLDGYLTGLIGLHQKKAHDFLHELRGITTIDPDYIDLVIKYKVPAMFQMQVLRNKDNRAFYSIAESIDQKEDAILGRLWSEYLGIEDNPEVAIRYFGMVRDTFYARISFRDLNYEFLQHLLSESKLVVRQIAEGSIPVDVVSARRQ